MNTNLLRKKISKLLEEAISLDVKPGDVILTGRFKNKRRIVKTIGTDKFGQPTINGKSILKFKIEKNMSKKKWSAKSRAELKEVRKLVRKIIQESIETESPYIEKIKMLGEQDPMQAFFIAQSLPDFESMDLSFLYPDILERIADNIHEQIPERSYPEIESSSRGWDIGFEFADSPKRFYAADGMNLTDAQVEERKTQEQSLADLAMSTIEEYSDMIKSEFALIDQEVVSEEQVTRARGTTVEKTMVFTLMQSEVIVEIETFKNTLDIRLQFQQPLK